MVEQRIVKEFADYGEFVSEMQNQGWIRKQKSIDENTNAVVNTFSVTAGVDGRVVDITCPAGYIMTTKGTEQIPAGADRGSAHALVLRLAGTDGTELDRQRKIKIEIIKPFEDTKMVIRDFYSMFSLTKQGATATVARLDKGDNEIYRWRRGIALYTQEILRISAINPDIAVNSAQVRIQADFDFWYKQI